jgi:hypothetical protein
VTAVVAFDRATPGGWPLHRALPEAFVRTVRARLAEVLDGGERRPRDERGRRGGLDRPGHRAVPFDLAGLIVPAAGIDA